MLALIIRSYHTINVFAKPSQDPSVSSSQSPSFSFSTALYRGRQRGSCVSITVTKCCVVYLYFFPYCFSLIAFNLFISFSCSCIYLIIFVFALQTCCCSRYLATLGTRHKWWTRLTITFTEKLIIIHLELCWAGSVQCFLELNSWLLWLKTTQWEWWE